MATSKFLSSRAVSRGDLQEAIKSAFTWWKREPSTETRNKMYQELLYDLQTTYMTCFVCGHEKFMLFHGMCAAVQSVRFCTDASSRLIYNQHMMDDLSTWWPSDWAPSRSQPSFSPCGSEVSHCICKTSWSIPVHVWYKKSFFFKKELERSCDT